MIKKLRHWQRECGATWFSYILIVVVAMIFAKAIFSS